MEREKELRAFLMGAAVAYSTRDLRTMEVAVAAGIKVFGLTAKEFFEGADELDNLLKEEGYTDALNRVSVGDLTEVGEVMVKHYTPQEEEDRGYA